MNRNNTTYLLLLFFIGFISCKNDRVSTAYFTGQIANPKEKNIHLLKNNIPIKKAAINSENNFAFKIDSIQEGLFTFKHGNEIQYFYLLPKDSLVMRLNTWDFDESLIFSGRGAEKNNFLMHLFLENEKQEKLFYSYYRLNEDEFLHKTDSLLQVKLTALKQFKENNKLRSQKYDALIHLAIYYPIYSHKEKYANLSRIKHKKLSQSFYDFRKDVVLNRNDFTDFYAYRNYVKNYFTNISNKIALKETVQSQSIIMLRQIDKELKNSPFKDDLLQNATLNCLLDENCSFQEKQRALNSFYNNCENNQKINEIKSISNSMQFIQKGNKLPPLQVTNFQGKNILISAKKIGANTVIYFWPKERNRILFMLKRLKYLQKKYKNIRFIGIDSQLDKNNWKNYIKTNHLNPNYQFRLEPNEAKKWFCNELPRAIIVDKSGIIQNNFSYIAQRDFENLLKKLSKF